MTVREWTEGCEVDQALLVRAAEERCRKDGAPYLRLTLGDCSGWVTAMLREGVEGLRDTCASGRVVWVRGRFSVHPRFGPELDVLDVRPAREDEWDPRALLDGPPQPVDRMEEDLRSLVATVQSAHLRGLLEWFFCPGSDTWRDFREAPAAKRFHQAYRHGLLEHCLTVAQSVGLIAATFPGVDRDVAVTGALLHDIGKLDAYSADPMAIDLTDAGKLAGEIPLGYYRVRRAIEELPGFPPATAQAVLHIILSHHGSLEHGSPVAPCTREAWLVHQIDDLGGKLGSFDRLEKELPSGAAWSPFDRALGGSAFFGPPVPDESSQRAA